MDEKTAEFVKRLHDVFFQAIVRVNEQERLGENRFTSLPDMFPHGAQDTAFMVYTKACRALGYIDSHNFVKAREEYIDIINYAGFSIILLENKMQEEIDNESKRRLSESHAPSSGTPVVGPSVLQSEKDKRNPEKPRGNW